MAKIALDRCKQSSWLENLVADVREISSAKNRAGSRFLFLAEFLENGIAAQMVPERIEPKKGRRNGYPARTVAPKPKQSLHAESVELSQRLPT